MKELYAPVAEHIAGYEQGTITISDDIEFSMRKTVRQITHYIRSAFDRDVGRTDHAGQQTGA